MPSAVTEKQLSATVLLPAHNEGETIGACIQAIHDSSYPIEEIIVVADNCNDDTAAIAESMGARVVHTTFGDKAFAQNFVLDDIKTDVIVGFDGDTIPKSNCIELMMRDIEKGADATCATVLPIQPKGFFIRARRFAYALGRRWWRLAQATVGRIQVLTGAAYVFRTDAIKAVGGFPTGLLSGDMPATWALHVNGYKCDYSGDAVALTYDPETFSVYRAQIRRWASGYWQTMWMFRRHLFHWKSVLVVWTAIFDLLALGLSEVVIIWSIVNQHWHYLEILALWIAVHALVTAVLVATVVGIKEAVIGLVPYMLVNVYNKWVYLIAGVREIILGKRYAAWTGRQGRKTVIEPMSRVRKLFLSTIAIGTGLGIGLSRLVF